MKITSEIVRELLHYDPETGIFTWRERRRSWFKTERARWRWNGKHAGKRAGGVCTNLKGYQCRRIKLLGRFRAEHRLAWLYMTDESLPPEIDHENRDGTDNRWLNLRASNKPENMRNKSMSRNNTSGVTGVSWHKSTGKWMAYCRFEGNRRHLGLFVDLDEAARAVRKFRVKNGFDPSHGMEPAHYHAP